MKSRAQPSSALPAHGASVASFDDTAVRASVSAASAYCEAASDVTGDVALLSNSPGRASAMKPWAGLLLSPSRSRTVLAYSRRVRGRRGAAVPVGPQAAHGDAAGPAFAGRAPAFPPGRPEPRP